MIESIAPEIRERDAAPQVANPDGEAVRKHLLESARVKEQAAGVLAEPTAEVAALIFGALSTGHKVLVCGNGGSAADAQHFAGEMVGRFKLRGRVALPVLALTADTSVLTCIANDFSYEELFSRQVEAFAQPGDVVIGISTSGGSPNILRAIRAARERGARAIALVGGGVGHHSKAEVAAEADLALVVPSGDTALIQECHLSLIHAICELVEVQIAAATGIEAC